MKRFVTEIFKKFMSEAEAKTLLKEIRNGVVYDALIALGKGERKIGDWYIPVRHRAESLRGYHSRLMGWAWKYIEAHNIITDYMSDDVYMEHPMYTLNI